MKADLRHRGVQLYAEPTSWSCDNRVRDASKN
jgi:hypothetical protein